MAAAQELPTGAVSAGDAPAFSVATPAGAIEYFGGRGLRIGRTGLTVGGFSTLELDREDGDAGTLELDSVNLLILYQPVDFFRIFSELEIGGLALVELDHGDTHSDPSLTAERLFADFSHGDALNLRIGKFQTPVGRWNLVPAEPFVWTASEPVMLERSFDEHQTGAALFGSAYPGANTLHYWIYGQFVDPLDADTDPAPAERTFGGRLELAGPLESWSVGISALASQRKDDWSYLGGLDALWRVGPLELSGEFLFNDGDIVERKLWAIYLQSVYDLGSLHSSLQNLYLVGRYERFDPAGRRDDAHVWDLGLTWMPRQYLNVKAGYRFSDRPTEDVRRGVTASLSVLF